MRCQGVSLYALKTIAYPRADRHICECLGGGMRIGCAPREEWVFASFGQKTRARGPSSRNPPCSPYGYRVTFFGGRGRIAKPGTGNKAIRVMAGQYAPYPPVHFLGRISRFPFVRGQRKSFIGGEPSYGSGINRLGPQVLRPGPADGDAAIKPGDHAGIQADGGRDFLCGNSVQLTKDAGVHLLVR